MTADVEEDAAVANCGEDGGVGGGAGKVVADEEAKAGAGVSADGEGEVALEGRKEERVLAEQCMV